jgi:hypothetical protein
MTWDEDKDVVVLVEVEAVAADALRAGWEAPRLLALAATASALAVAKRSHTSLASPAIR